MNEAFCELAGMVRESGRDFSNEDLIASLHLLCYPRSLSRVIAACQRLHDLVAYESAFFQEISSARRERIQTLLSLAEIASDLSEPIPPRFLAPTTKVYSQTPLRPYSGDGPAAEALLIVPEAGVDRDNHNTFLRWWVWQLIEFADRLVPLEKYAHYLSADSDKVAGSLRTSTDIGTAANANYFIRAFAAKKPSVPREDGDLELPALDRMLSLDLRLTQQASEGLTAVLDAAVGGQIIDSHTMAELVILSKRKPAQISFDLKTLDHFQGPVRVFMDRLWNAQYVAKKNGRRAKLKRRLREITETLETPKLRIFDGWAVETQPEGDDDDGPISGDIHVPRPPPDRPDGDEEEPEDKRAYEPDVVLYVADDKEGHARISWQAKARRHRTERRNACLAWDRDRLSRHALDEVWLLIQGRSDHARVDKDARWLLALLFLTERPIGRLVRCGDAPNAKSALDADAQLDLCWCRRTQRLWVRTGVPDASESVDERLLPVLHARSPYIALALPKSVLFLLHERGSAQFSDGQAVTARKALKKALKKLPAALAITPRRVQGCLSRQIRKRTGNDSAAVAVITATYPAGAKNIIHYASYPRPEIERLWSNSVEEISGEQPSPCKIHPEEANQFVGSLHPLRADVVAEHVEAVHRRLLDAVSNYDKVRTFNLYTYWIVLRSNLAMASRASLHPAPLTVLDPGWLLAIDKGRMDGSMDRLVPGTESYINVLNGYVGYCWHLAGVDSRFRVTTDSFRHGMVQFHFMTRGGDLVPFQPSAFLSHEKLAPLPGNWARKIIRTESRALGGRLLEAILGHFVQGRHHWRLTSSMRSPHLFDTWVKEAQRLEALLGLDAKLPAELRTVEPPVWPMTSYLHPAEDKSEIDHPCPTDAEIEARLIESDPDLYLAISQQRRAEQSTTDSEDSESFAEESPLAPIALDLALNQLRSLNIKQRAALLVEAEATCAWVRRHWRLPVFVARALGRFERDWQVNRVALMNLAHLERAVLPKFQSELKLLPHRSDDPVGRKADVGRLVMLLIWQPSLLSWSQIKDFLSQLLQRPPTAAGLDRYVVINGNVRHSEAKHRRNTILGDYLSVYVSAEYPYLVETLAALWDDKDKRLRNRIEGCLVAYLDQIGAPRSKGMLSIMLDAAHQALMLRTSPILAAAARGELITTDYDESAFLRIRNLQLPRDEAEQSLPSSQSDMALPGFEANPDDFVQEVCRLMHGSADAAIEAIQRIEANNLAHALLKVFSIYLIEKAVETDRRTGARLSCASRYQDKFAIVGYGLLGNSPELITGSRPVITADWIRELAELTELTLGDYSRGVVMAWNQFRGCLRRKKRVIEALGIRIESIGKNGDPAVHARMITADEQHLVEELLRSARSGIGNSLRRDKVRRTASRMRMSGMRRGEAQKNRTVDQQRDLRRIQPYDDEGLKTDAANRVLPSLLFEDGDELNSESVSKTKVFVPSARDDVTTNDRDYDLANKVVKWVTGDPHTYLYDNRHHFSSGVLTTALSGLNQSPWLEGQRLPADSLRALLETEEDWGQLFQQSAACKGHQHETTTMRHYVHSMGLVLHACAPQPPSILKAFAQRMKKSRASMFRLARRLNDAGAGRCEVLGEILELAEEAVVVSIDRAEARVHTPPILDPDTGGYDACEALERIVWRPHELAAGESQKLPSDVSSRLQSIYEIRSQDGESRHNLHEVGNVHAPAELKAAGPTRAAYAVSNWLSKLHEQDLEAYHWLLNRYLYGARKDEGRMSIGQGDVSLDWLRGIWMPEDVQIWLVPTRRESGSVEEFDPLATAWPKHRVDLRVRGLQPEDGGGWKPVNHDSMAVAWAFIWSAARLGWNAPDKLRPAQ